MKKHLELSSKDDNQLAIFLATLHDVARDMQINVKIVRISE